MLIIDSDNYKSASIETLFFPGGEPHAKVPLFKEPVLFFLKPRTWYDTGLGMCVWDALQRQYAGHRLFIPYFPGARQDRSKGEAPLTAELMYRAFATFYSDMSVFDLHSINTIYGLDVRNLMPAELDIPKLDNVAGIIAPDEGAAQRASEFQEKFYPGTYFIQCSKKRDPHTGRLSGYHCPELNTTGHYVIVDDICDGGGTFNLLAEAFFASEVGKSSKLSMFVSHGIFSKGLRNIDSRIETIITTDSWCKPEYHSNNPRLKVIPLLPQLISYF
jgi:ribose-phosphate pyrophosphokinase